LPDINVFSHVCKYNIQDTKHMHNLHPSLWATVTVNFPHCGINKVYLISSYLKTYPSFTLIGHVIYLDEHCPACICCSSWAEASVADCSEKDGYGGELRTRNPFLVSNREGKNDKEDREDEIQVWLKVVPAKVVLCLLHIKARFKTCQQRSQSSEVLPSLEEKQERFSDIIYTYIICYLWISNGLFVRISSDFICSSYVPSYQLNTFYTPIREFAFCKEWFTC